MGMDRQRGKQELGSATELEMKTIESIAYKATHKLYPSLSASIMMKADATHPEIVMGREAQCRQLDETVAVIAEAIREAQQESEDVMLFLASAAIDMMTLHSPSTEETMRDAIDKWKRWKLKTGRKQSGQNDHNPAAGSTLKDNE